MLRSLPQLSLPSLALTVKDISKPSIGIALSAMMANTIFAPSVHGREHIAAMIATDGWIGVSMVLGSVT